MTTTTIAANAVAAAHIQGLQAFMASEVKERATDAQLEAAAGGGAGAQAQLTLSRQTSNAVGCC